MTAIAHPPAYPAVLNLHAGMSIKVQESRGYFSARLKQMLQDRTRNRDINGDGIGFVMSLTKWRYADQPYLALAQAPEVDQAVAAGWAAPIRWASSGQLGVNLSYATMPGYEGKGLARLSAALAYLRLCEDAPAYARGKVNIQCHSENQRSIALAHSLGFAQNEAANFYVESLDRHYLGFSCSAQGLQDLAMQLLDDRRTPDHEHAPTTHQPRQREAA